MLPDIYFMWLVQDRARVCKVAEGTGTGEKGYARILPHLIQELLESSAMTSPFHYAPPQMIKPHWGESSRNHPCL